ncbi:MAG: glucosamine-6-phosphate deaminase [Verrucomicrobiae bacterium]|nr:glucosamine-6-phosphate deaminase [Verrucomicrobiae bacterium]
MDVVIQPTADAACRLVARVIAGELRRKPHLVLGLATGATMEGVYRELVRLHREEQLDFSRCRTFNLDEYIGLTPADPNSYHRFMREHFFDPVNMDLRQTHLPDGCAADLDMECRRYEEAIRRAGGIDLQILGIGKAGHIGFNEPLSAFRSRTRVKALSPVTLKQNAPQFVDPSKMPRRAITMGVGTILDTSRCLLLATGAAKADIMARAVEGPITAMISATALQLHPRCSVVVDEDAAARLQGVAYYRWTFENEPEWEAFR